MEGLQKLSFCLHHWSCHSILFLTLTDFFLVNLPCGIAQQLEIFRTVAMRHIQVLENWLCKYKIVDFRMNIIRFKKILLWVMFFGYSDFWSTYELSNYLVALPLHTGISCKNIFHSTIIPPWRVFWVSREANKLKEL